MKGFKDLPAVLTGDSCLQAPCPTILCLPNPTDGKLFPTFLALLASQLHESSCSARRSNGVRTLTQVKGPSAVECKTSIVDHSEYFGVLVVLGVYVLWR